MKLVLVWHDGQVRAARLDKNHVVILQTAGSELDRLGVAAVIDSTIIDT